MSGDGDRDETREAIMDATYRALCEHGYASLTMQDIADEFEKSKSLFYYHFDTKDDLLVAFIDHVLVQFEQEVEAIEGTPDERLAAFVDRFVIGEDEQERKAFHLALLELRAQAPFNERYREQLVRSDEMIRGTIAEIVRDGIEKGVFRNGVDPETIARFVLAAMDGARTRQITLDAEGYTGTVRDTLYEHVLDDIRIAGGG